jgi:hypothetical protein
MNFTCVKKRGKSILLEYYQREGGKPERITNDSILNRGWKIIADDSHVKNIYFVRVEMQGT